jgi:gentisate 1,2-dioxygenase
MTVTEPDLPVGIALEDWTGDARFHEYTRAANPVGRTTPLVPVEAFPAALHHDAPTGVIPLDLSGALGIEGYPATSPALLASFATVRAGEHLVTEPRATSELYVVMRGAGTTELADGGAVAWAEGDVFVLPGGHRSTHRATADALFYWVTDEPLLRYLGVQPTERRLRPTLWPAARNAEELAKVAADPAAERRNRVSILLNNADQPQTLTATHVLWAMVGLLPVDAVQKPHRHQSVALDLILDCRPGCYTLVGPRLADDGSIVDARRVDWEPGGAFVTPPGWWHAHHNESGAEAHLLPVQDAGLHTHLRTLDIRFS